MARIFEAKGRPAHNPLIVHVADVERARHLAAEWPEAAQRLASRFWPGPLSLVVERKPVVPDIVTGGGSSVALRVPCASGRTAIAASLGLAVGCTQREPVHANQRLRRPST